jgi:hypothetical protein
MLTVFRGAPMGPPRKPGRDAERVREPQAMHGAAQRDILAELGVADHPGTSNRVARM